MTLQRREGWEQAYVRVGIAAMKRPHAWGEHDCVMFVCDCIAAMTGEDLAADFRGQYDNEREARALLARLGYVDIGALASSRLPEIDPAQAQRGDVVLIPGEEGEYLAIVDGRTAVGPAARGLTHAPLGLAKRAWRVG